MGCVNHGDLDAPGGNGATLVHSDDLGRGVEFGQPQAHLVDAGPDWGCARGDGNRVRPIHSADLSAQVIEVAMADQQNITAIDRVCSSGGRGVAEPRIQN
jgi:hypothetical protein